MQIKINYLKVLTGAGYRDTLVVKIPNPTDDTLSILSRINGTEYASRLSENNFIVYLRPGQNQYLLEQTIREALHENLNA